MKRFAGCALILAFFTVSPALAAGASEPSSAPRAAPADPLLERARAALQGQDWKGAQDLLKDGLARSPENADYHNLYAYAIRKGPNPNLDLAFKHYDEALRIDPKHRGAHEYIGEAYLMVGNVAKAKEHLAALDKICFFSCEEFRDLKKAVSEYETKHAKQ